MDSYLDYIESLKPKEVMVSGFLNVEKGDSNNYSARLINLSRARCFSEIINWKKVIGISGSPIKIDFRQ